MSAFLRIKSPRRVQLRSRLNYLQVIPFTRDRSYSFFYDDESKEIDAVNDVVKAAGQETGEPEQAANEANPRNPADSDSKQRKLWTAAIGRKDWLPNAY